ncbi:AMP-binding protein [Myxococcota bacterium]|nr:AMP-binding protein [Myxococcota bacterium]
MSALDLLAGHASDAPVAFGAAGVKTAAELLVDAGRIARALPPASPGSHVLLVSGGDRYAIAAALLGALARGHAVALPPNLRRESIFAVQSRPEIAALLHDTEAGIPLRLSQLLASPDGGPPLVAPFAPRAGVLATVFTSGSTGPLVAAPKTAAALFGEAHALAKSFGIGPGDRIVGSVPPVHIYGLLFTLLLPLAAGAAFARETPHHAEAIAHCVRSHRAALLVTVPVQLRALAGLREGALAGLAQVVSSTGPLPDAVAREFRERHGLAVREVFGSTETGGIAHRLRSAEPPERWRPFDGVEVSTSVDGRLAVDSPFLDEALPRPFVTGDLVELAADGRFEHLGRVDGIVKIAGRRVSLQEMEDALRRQPGVADAAVVAIAAEAGRGHQLLAAVAPADCELARVRAGLLEQFEPSCLPRRLIGLDAVPREENGKLQRARVLRRFGLGPDERPLGRALDFETVELRREGEREGEFEEGIEAGGAGRVSQVRASVRLPAGWDAFDGHFEGHPVLAGALQMKELILPLVRHAFPELRAVRGLSRVKFTGRIVPEDALTIALVRVGAGARIRFEILRGDELCSSGLLELEAAETS